jgi:hypothetical protein
VVLFSEAGTRRKTKQEILKVWTQKKEAVDLGNLKREKAKKSHEVLGNCMH